jgi:hypothetical protein
MRYGMHGRNEMYIGFWWKNLKKRRPLGRPRHRWEAMCLKWVTRDAEFWLENLKKRDWYRQA